MKCKFCDGSGKDYWGRNGEPYPCPVCNGTGEYEPFDADIELDKLDSEPKTNEEYLRSCNTEEKAKEIYKIAKDDFKELRKLFYGVANDDCDAVALWLKQPHKGD